MPYFETGATATASITIKNLAPVSGTFDIDLVLQQTGKTAIGASKTGIVLAPGAMTVITLPVTITSDGEWKASIVVYRGTQVVGLYTALESAVGYSFSVQIVSAGWV